MSRLEKKCLLGSAAMHGLLVVVFLFGSAFFTPKTRQDTLPVINFLPDKLVDQMLYGGGNPNLQPLPPPPPAPQPQPQPIPLPPPPKAEPPPEPAKPKETVRPKEPEPKERGEEPVPTKAKPKETATKPPPRINTNVVKYAKFDPEARRAEREARERAQAEARAYAQYQRQVANASRAFGSAVSGLGSSLSTSTISVEAFGPGGYAFANYGQWVKSVYDHAWVVTDDLADDDSTVKVRVTIGRDGTVISGRIIVPSRNSALNKSVQGVLEDVRTIGKPFPEGAKEDQRTFMLNFNLKAKRQLG
jgi:colicin import membrane protein